MTSSRAVNGKPVPEPPGAEEPATRLIRRRPLHDEAAERLRDMIVEGHLAAGERVNEADLCAQLGISRTPLREALKVLAAEGLVELLPRRGARIARLGAREVGELFEVLSGLERTAAELAAVRVTAKDLARLRRLQQRIEQHHQARRRHEYFHENQVLHEAIVALSGNAVLKETHARVMVRVRRARYAAILSQERWDESVREHAGILAALEAGDARRAGELMHRHVARTGEVVGAALEPGTGPRGGRGPVPGPADDGAPAALPRDGLRGGPAARGPRRPD